MIKKDLMEDIIVREWEMFQQVNNIGGRASCQNDQNTFCIMRESQFVTYPEELLESYLDDLKTAKNTGRNLLTEKYARMMASTHPTEYEQLKDFLPEISPETSAQIENIVTTHVNWKMIVGKKYPNINKHGRPLTSDNDSRGVTSFETYLRGELQSYSAKTVAEYNKYVEECLQADRNLAEENLQKMMERKGYKSLEEADIAAKQSILRVM